MKRFFAFIGYTIVYGCITAAALALLVGVLAVIVAVTIFILKLFTPLHPAVIGFASTLAAIGALIGGIIAYFKVTS